MGRVSCPTTVSGTRVGRFPASGQRKRWFSGIPGSWCGVRLCCPCPQDPARAEGGGKSSPGHFAGVEQCTHNTPGA
eukprot:gene15671-biopygen15757